MNEQTNCAHCKNPIDRNFCADCGAATPERIDFNYAKSELLQLVGYEKGFVYTVRKLLTAPGETIHGYLLGNRSAIMKPVSFLFVASLLFTLISHYLKVESVYEHSFRETLGNSGITYVMAWIQDNYGYANAIMMIVIAVFVRLFFPARTYNFYELLAMLCFVMGQGMVLLSIMPIQAKYTGSAWLENAIYVIVAVYIVWAIGRFFGGKTSDYAKAFAAYLIGFLVFQISATVLAILYDLVIA